MVAVGIASWVFATIAMASETLVSAGVLVFVVMATGEPADGAFYAVGLPIVVEAVVG